MMIKFSGSLVATTTLAALIASGSTAFAFTGEVSNNLHMRTGPGEQYQIITTVDSQSDVEVHGCLEKVTWCDINWGSIRGWAAGEYIVYRSDEGIKPLPLAGDMIGIPVVTFTAVDEIVPVFVGVFEEFDETVTEISPPKQVSAYVEEQDIDTVLVQGEVAVGAVVPEKVPLYAVPESKYSFTNVNGRNVLVTNDRKVVHIFG